MEKKERMDMLKEIMEAYNESRQYDDVHLFDDHIGWLKTSFNKGWFEFPDDYDFDTSIWCIGKLIAQVERYGGVVIETKKGLLPVTDLPDEVLQYYEEDDKELQNLHFKRIGKKINEFINE